MRNGDYYIYNNNKFKLKNLTEEEIGNMHFGYVASVLFSRRLMHFGAGMYKIVSDKGINPSWMYSYYDEPKDFTFIDVGRSLWASHFKKYRFQL